MLVHVYMNNLISWMWDGNPFTDQTQGYVLMIDAWLTIHLLQVLSIVQSPYSPDFNSAFLPLVQNNEITGPLVNADMTDPVSIFIGIRLCILLSP